MQQFFFVIQLRYFGGALLLGYQMLEKQLAKEAIHEEQQLLAKKTYIIYIHVCRHMCSARIC